jgi:hypothetical protein
MQGTRHMMATPPDDEAYIPSRQDKLGKGGGYLKGFNTLPTKANHRPQASWHVRAAMHHLT